MPRKYRLSRKRRYRRRYKKSRTLRGKRKAAKALRQSEVYVIKQQFSNEWVISQIANVTVLRFFDSLFKSQEFLSMRQNFDQFRLDAVSVSLQVNSGVYDYPFILGGCLDRNGFNVEYPDVDSIMSYSSYRTATSTASHRAFLKFYVAATTMNEKSQYIPSDIQGVLSIRDKNAWSPTCIPCYRSIYFPFNPAIAFFVRGLTNVNAQAGAALLGTITYYITFRGARKPISGQNPDIVVHAAGDPEIEIETGGDYEQTVTVPTKTKDYALVEPTLIAKSSIISPFTKLNFTGTTNPIFGAVSNVVSSIVTDLGRELFDSWTSQIKSYCVTTLSSLISGLSSYAISRVSGVIDSFTGAFAAIDPRSSFYWLDNVSTGFPSDVEATQDFNSYLGTFNVGKQLLPLFNKQLPSIMSTISFTNDAQDLYMFTSRLSFNASSLRYLYNQKYFGQTAVSWSSASVTTSSVVIAPFHVYLFQIPHANYWITGLFYNRSYTGSATSDTVINYSWPLSSVKDLRCIDGSKWINTEVSSYIYYKDVGVYSDSATSSPYALVYTLCTNNATTQIGVDESAIYTGVLPVSAFLVGLGVSGYTGPIIDVTEFGLLYPLFLSKNKLLN